MRKLMLFVFALGIFAGCTPTTKLIAAWSPEELETQNYKKLAIVVFSPRMSSRAILETEIAKKFRENGIKAVATYDIFPLAGKIDKIRENMEEATIQRKIKEAVARHEIDGLMMITLLDKEKEERYVQGSSIGLTGAYPYGGAYGGVYGYPYYGYYSYASTTVYNSGYYETTTTYFVESNLYDTATEKLIWTAQTETKNPASIEKESVKFADIIVSDILLKKVVK